MESNRSLEAHRWYQIGVIMAVIGVFSAFIAVAISRVGYPLDFMCTMMAVIAISIPGWELPKNRARLVLTNLLILAIEIGILTFGLAATQTG